MEKIVERETFQGIKVRKVIALGEFHRGQLSREFFFFYLGFLSRTFTIHRTEGEGGGYFFKSSLPIPPASQTLRHYPGRYYRELASAHSQQPDSNREPVIVPVTEPVIVRGNCPRGVKVREG